MPSKSLAALALVALAGAGMVARYRVHRGTVELRWSLVPAPRTPIGQIEARPAWAGVNAGGERDAGWLRIALQDKVVALAVEPGVPTAVVARGSVPAGRYARVFVAAPVVWTTDPEGHQQQLTSHIEPIAIPFELRPGGTVEIEIELTVLPATDLVGGGPEVFVRGARVLDGADVAGGAYRSAPARSSVLLDLSKFGGN